MSPLFTDPAYFVIPGRAKREPGIHNHGFRACAKRRIPE